MIHMKVLSSDHQTPSPSKILEGRKPMCTWLKQTRNFGKSDSISHINFHSSLFYGSVDEEDLKGKSVITYNTDPRCIPGWFSRKISERGVSVRI